MSFMDVRMKELLPTLVSSLDLISLESIHKFLQDGEFQVNFENDYFGPALFSFGNDEKSNGGQIERSKDPTKSTHRDMNINCILA
ncbi:hypothetical protein P5673_005661 [Acropora cervicornis]|uniref:Uncharacterized protein n=1 Tax=Acropora cervicornis TaxID=6130 RepID=A0AAD9VDD9_ACRCE|nr:hypothetical protein P5673_005661 [Acropora cervicornis]